MLWFHTWLPHHLDHQGHQDHRMTHLTTGQWGTTNPFLLLLSDEVERLGSTCESSIISHFLPRSGFLLGSFPNQFWWRWFPQIRHFIPKILKIKTSLMTSFWKEPVNVENMQKMKKNLSESISESLHENRFWISRAKKEKSTPWTQKEKKIIKKTHSTQCPNESVRMCLSQIVLQKSSPSAVWISFPNYCR